MAQPKVSVLISFYNLAPYVDQTLESVLGQQTDFPVEVLCADDGSDDGTIEKLREWEQKYPETIRVFVMDRIPGAKYEANERIKRMNAIRGRLFYEAKGEYILYVGTIEARKNLDFLLRAFDRFKRETGLPHKLVLAGGDGWENRAVYERAASVSCAADVRFLGYVSGPVKSALYDNASLFVFPSLYEGFGIPPLEAMEHGCPVVCSDAASLPEVVGDAALTVGVSDEVGLAGAMHRVLTDASLAHSLAERGRARARAFSWDDSAVKLAAVCREVLDEAR